MEFLYSNYINTTGVISVDSSTNLADNLFNRDETFQFSSENFSSDLTTSSITISFNETLTVDRIALLGINLKGFTIFYDGDTTNTFPMTTTSNTTTSDFSSNSETSLYIRTTPTNCTSVTIDMKTTIVSDQEKAIGFYHISQKYFEFDKIPTSKGYRPLFKNQQIVHRLSDGGTRIQTIGDKFETTIKIKNIQTSFRNQLKTIYDLKDDFVFSAFGTTSSWDGIIYPVVWEGNFDFFTYSDNAVSSGHSGSIRLKEIPT